MVTQTALAGTAHFVIDGTAYQLVGKLAWDPATVSRESAPGMDGIHGFIEKPVAPHIAGTFRDAGDLSVAAINNMTNVTVVCALVNGKTVTGRNMWQVGEIEVNSEDGTFDIRWEGPQGAVTEGN
ncbi:MAG TPA: phage tail tube protein [Rhizomicrobium sp.]|jgi:hypothetical protein|nr:phage tail tube protein [Rhizomicrobium sp.]